MAEEKDQELGEFCHAMICKVENGYEIKCQYEHKMSLSERKGWVPSVANDCKDYVEKTKAAVIERLKKVL